MPAVAEAYPAAGATVPDLPARQPVAAVMARAELAAETAAVAEAPTPLPALDELTVTSAWSAAQVTATHVALARPPAPPLFDATRLVPLTGLPVAHAALAPDVLPADTAAFNPSASVALAGADEDAGFLSDATDMLKKTGSTVVNGTMKAGVPFVSMARFLGGAFRKITPFKN